LQILKDSGKYWYTGKILVLPVLCTSIVVPVSRPAVSYYPEVSFTVKVEESGDIAALVDMFSKEMVRFKQHFCNVECKMAREIQSVHFGASKRQIRTSFERTTNTVWNALAMTAFIKVPGSTTRISPFNLL
jgi:hypothetical protein